MPKYHVPVVARTMIIFEVHANSKEEAKNLVEAGILEFPRISEHEDDIEVYYPDIREIKE